MLQVRELKFSYKKHLILENIHFEIHGGEIVSILGLNGSGKTTLLKAIAKIEKAKKGIVSVEGIDIFNLPQNELAKIIGYLPQKSQGEQVTVYDAILLGRKIYINFSPSKEDLKIVQKTIKDLHLEHLVYRFTDELSGGELQKVLIARALVQEPKVLLLDEPINHLDIYNQLEVMNIIREVVDKLKIIALVVTHDINTTLRYSNKFIFLKNKKVFAFGDKKIITPETIKAVYNVDVEMAELSGTLMIAPKFVPSEKP